MSKVLKLDSITLPVPPCCIEFWPRDPDYFAVGTYVLQKDEPEDENDERPDKVPKAQARAGSIVLLKLDKGKIETISTLHTEFAVLDLHFHPFHVTILTASTSTGSLVFYELAAPDSGSPHPRLIPRFALQTWEPTTLVTSFAWNPYRQNCALATLASGEIEHLLITNECWMRRMQDPNAPEQVQVGSDPIISLPPDSAAEGVEKSGVDRRWLMVDTLYKHNLEAWCASFTPSGRAVVSGADDAALRGYNAWEPPADALSGPLLYNGYFIKMSQFKWELRKMHDAGVTAVLPISDSLCVTGSYDEHIRLIEVPEHAAPSRKRVVAQLRLGGGVWRLKLMDTPVPRWEERFDILCSCMHAGVRIVRLSRSSSDKAVWHFKILAEFTEHKSMNYASDARPVPTGVDTAAERARSNIIVSTSYYDKLVCAWRVTVPPQSGGEAHPR